jgi:hypothetical protein
VSIREYARQVGRNYKTIAAMVNGYATHREGASAITLNEAIERAKMGAERELATEAVAKVRGIFPSPSRVRPRPPRCARCSTRPATWWRSRGSRWRRP